MRRALVVGLVLALLASTGALWLWQRYQEAIAELGEPLPLEQATEYTIAPGTSFARVADDMQARGWVRSGRLFAWHAGRHDQAHRIKAGTYLLEPGMSAVDALALFLSGREIQYRFTIVEGWTFRQLRAALAEAPRLTRTLDGVDGDTIMSRLGRPDRHPEGQFLADTYLFPPGTTDLDLLARAHAALERRLSAAWEARSEDLPLDDPYQALILASIIEKETGLAEERDLIAGVFVRRMRRGMLLQTDPTVIYGLGESFDGNLTRAHLRTDTPYNTYTRKGLPPTPIALVGPQAIEAALHPRDEGFLYFVARGDGSHQFSRTYAEHLQAVRRYQLGGRGSASGS